ncbi:sel1 repeat family protein, partial [Pseudomonas juntendi]|nr:sel1 repeat family protein [Pseudomonas juntendi]
MKFRSKHLANSAAPTPPPDAERFSLKVALWL